MRETISVALPAAIVLLGIYLVDPFAAAGGPPAVLNTTEMVGEWMLAEASDTAGVLDLGEAVSLTLSDSPTSEPRGCSVMTVLPSRDGPVFLHGGFRSRFVACVDPAGRTDFARYYSALGSIDAARLERYRLVLTAPGITLTYLPTPAE